MTPDQIDAIEARTFDPARAAKRHAKQGQSLVVLTETELRGLIALARQALAAQQQAEP